MVVKLVDVRMKSYEAAVRSFETFFDLLEALLGNGLSVFDVFGMSRSDLLDLFSSESVLFPTSWAVESEGFQVRPGNTYSELVGALANHIGVNVVFSHGWPQIVSESTAKT